MRDGQPRQGAREFLRIDKTLPVRYRTPFSTKWRQGHTRNISGTGIALLAQGFFFRGIILELELEIPYTTPLPLTGKIVRVRRLPGQPEKEIGIHFVEIDAGEQKLLIQYIFNCQRRQS
ncbi:MAG: PilZ domain-containing protein [Armatimonadetes bacterium]|nr:PilZ domain-containing protein [Armatimonadota bacterium]